MTMSEAIKARAEKTGYSADWSEYAHYVRVEQAGYCGGCDHCCDTCLNDGHHCAVCRDVVGHNHSHEEDE
jgi:hypothetical protein